MHYSTLFTSLALLASTGWAQYTLEDDYFNGGSFFDRFSFFTGGDPTNGFVEYQSYSSARSSGLISNSSSNIYMGVDHTNVSPNGRPSVRIASTKSYNLGLVILDLEHMPGGICGTWPAFWMLGPNWPTTGEIDIIEGVHQQTGNDMTLHTGPDCSISNTNGFSGALGSTYCTSSGGDNTGCGIDSSNSQTYGSGFNAINGGVYATEWTATGIKIWFFPRSSIPSDITTGAPNPAGWGTPLAYFGGNQCSYTKSFEDLQIVFDTTFCGDWAGAVWSSSSCASEASTCDLYVQNNPSAFTNAYWSVNGLKVYQQSSSSAAADAADANAVDSSSPATLAPTVTPTTLATSTYPTTTSTTVSSSLALFTSSSASTSSSSSLTSHASSSASSTLVAPPPSSPTSSAVTSSSSSSSSSSSTVPSPVATSSSIPSSAPLPSLPSLSLVKTPLAAQAAGVLPSTAASSSSARVSVASLALSSSARSAPSSAAPSATLSASSSSLPIPSASSSSSSNATLSSSSAPSLSSPPPTTTLSSAPTTSPPSTSSSSSPSPSSTAVATAESTTGWAPVVAPDGVIDEIPDSADARRRGLDDVDNDEDVQRTPRDVTAVAASLKNRERRAQHLHAHQHAHAHAHGGLK